jgi:hypothetical protein
MEKARRMKVKATLEIMITLFLSGSVALTINVQPRRV